MKKNLLTLIISVASSGLLFSQVGINTETPKATLDIVATPLDISTIDGLIAPRLEGSELQSKNILYTSDQTGTLIYVKSPSPEAGTTGDKTIHVDAPGYYYFDGIVWVKSGSAAEPWNVQNTSNKASNNNENIYQQGKVAVGFTSADDVSKKQLEVKGDMNVEIQDTDGTFHQIVTNADLGGVVKTSGIYISDKKNVAEKWVTDLPSYVSGFTVRKGVLSNYTSNYLNNDLSNFNTAAFNALSDDTQSHFYAVTQNSNNQLTQILGQSRRDGINFLKVEAQNGEFNYAQISLGDSYTLNGQSKITFISRSGAAEADSSKYSFPISNGKPGQVLTTDGAAPGDHAQLEWKNLQDAVILKSPNGSCFKITVNNRGSLSTTSTPCLE